MRHPNGTNFRRIARLDIVARVRKLHETKLLKERPRWLEWCERVPPMENHNLRLQSQRIRNPYPSMVRFLLNKYPDLRFQDAYVDGNDWSKGNDAFRNDHPVMQFVARQLEFMNDGLSKPAAFEATENLFRKRRMQQEAEQKVLMAMALDSGFTPMFTTGGAYLEAEKAKAEMEHLKLIRGRLRDMTQAKLRELEAENAAGASGADGEGAARPARGMGLGQKKKLERDQLWDGEKERMSLVGDHVLEDIGALAEPEPERDAPQEFQDDAETPLEEMSAPVADKNREDPDPSPAVVEATEPDADAPKPRPRVELAPDLTPSKPEATISVVPRRAATGRSKKSSDDLARMLRGNSLDEDDGKEWDPDREDRRRDRTMGDDDDDDYDDKDPLDDLLDRRRRGGGSR